MMRGVGEVVGGSQGGQEGREGEDGRTSKIDQHSMLFAFEVPTHSCMARHVGSKLFFLELDVTHYACSCDPCVR
eukprot:763033-Hanusia_phi.AAC.4